MMKTISLTLRSVSGEFHALSTITSRPTSSSWFHYSIITSDIPDLNGFTIPFFFLSYLEFFPSPDALTQKYPSSKPKLLLAVPPNLSHGPSRALFTEFTSVTRNLVVLTSRGDPDTLTRRLYDQWHSGQNKDQTYRVGEPIDGTGEVLNIVVSLNDDCRI